MTQQFDFVPLVNQANERLAKGEYAEKILADLNKKIGGYGVQSVTNEDIMINRYYMYTICLYINLGDTYDETIVYDTELSIFDNCSWGSFYEDWLVRHQEEVNESRAVWEDFSDYYRQPYDELNPSQQSKVDRMIDVIMDYDIDEDGFVDIDGIAFYEDINSIIRQIDEYVKEFIDDEEFDMPDYRKYRNPITITLTPLDGLNISLNYIKNLKLRYALEDLLETAVIL